MKKLFLFAALALFGFLNVNAQGEGNDSGDNDEFTAGLAKGDWTLSASLNYYSSKQDEDKTSNFGFMPCVGYQVTDHINVGVSFGFMSDKAENDGVDYRDQSDFMVGASAAYFCRPTKRFSPFAGIGFNYLNMNDKLDDDFGKSNGIEVAANFGALFWLNDDWALNTSVAGISYSNTKGDFDGAEATSEFALDLNLKNVWFGVTRRF